jgi:hypothetical protein
MKIGPNKMANLLMVVFAFGIVLFIINVNDNLKGLRYQLNELYETKFDSCLLTKVQVNHAYEYASRDDYTVFYTNCSKKSYPILLDDFDRRDLFKSGNHITKSAKSLDLQLSNETEVSTIRLLDPKKYDNRPSSTKMLLVLIVLAVGLILILPNSFFEQK